MTSRFLSALVLAAVAATADLRVYAAEEGAPSGGPVSYYEEIRPIFQARCHGCHQPAKAKGKYVMTDFERLLGGGESGAAIVAHSPDESYLIEEITPNEEGVAEMPQKNDPLTPSEIALVRRWIAEGAIDDTPANVRQRYDRDHPPIYTVPPVITSIDYSPDGKLLAVSGHHEVLLHRADGSGLEGRLIGLSERIESVRFSPDGKRLAVTGGLPARMGEVQIWDLEKQELAVSVPVTFDTVYGVSWSPDGRLVAFGGADTSVRVVDAETGAEVLFNAAHDDWALDTAFSGDGSHLVSVGRDQTVKLFEVATQRFVDNVTSITPGALRGGIQAVARHPGRDEVLVGGADGVPQIFRLFRVVNRVIGDNSNLIRLLPAMRGRIFSVDFSPDGARAAAGSSLDGHGAVNIYATVYDSTVTDELKGIFGKVADQRSAEEKAKVEEFQTREVALLHAVEIPESPVYALAFSPDGATIAAGGGDGQVRIIDAAGGVVRSSFPVVQVARHRPEEIAALEVEPASATLAHAFDYAQCVVTAVLTDGTREDVTALSDFRGIDGVAGIDGNGRIRAEGEGEGEVIVRYAGHSAAVPVRTADLSIAFQPDYFRDVNPVITRLGCNAGTCHGAKDGKNGFKLSLRGYDALFDLRAFADDHAARRLNVASPDDSLMLLKATGAVPHEGGQLTRIGDDYYEILKSWIEAGAPMKFDAPRVASIRIFPENPVLQEEGSRQQVRVVAAYTDGSERDVTREAFIESGNTDVTTADEGGILTVKRRGEAPILARFEGAYAATTITVMGDREGFAWEEPPSWSEVDRLVAAKWQRTKTLPSGLCTDEEFLRRVHLDLTGLPPTPEELRAFVADERDTRVKRDEVIDRLIGNDAFVDHWTNKWADLLQVNRKFLGPEGSSAFRDWIRRQVAENTPYDDFVRSILTASGSNRENPAASYFKILRTPDEIMENTTHLFLATRFNCNKCHDHPFERWTQDQYYEMSAFFARVGLERDPESGDRNIGGTAVEGAKPLYEMVLDRPEGEVVHDRTGEVTPPEFPYAAEHDTVESDARRIRLAAWMTSPDNRYFASSYVNRIWGYLLGTGIIEPIDDIRAGNPPSNPELLDWLTGAFVESGFDVRHLMRTICKSRVYQLSVATNRWNEDDAINYSHAKARRLPAEVLYDTIYAATGATPRIPGLAPGTRAAAIPDAGVKLADGFLGNLGRPVRESACECERSSEIQLGSVMALLSGPTVGDAISDPENALARLAGSEMSDPDMISEVFVRVLNRDPSTAEVDAVLQAMGALDPEHEALTTELAAYEAEIAPARAKAEEARLAAIESARTGLAAYEAEIAPREEELDRQQQERIAAVEAEVAAYESALPDALAAWEASQGDPVEWEVLALGGLGSTSEAVLTAEEDGSVVVSGPNGKVTYSAAALIDGRGITGVRLELPTDDRLPNRGPGRADNGNFVLTEFEVHAHPQGRPEDKRKLAFQRAVADFSQEGYDVASAIDGQAPEANNGWASHPETGKDRTAVFELSEPLAMDGPVVLEFALIQNHNDGKHTIGKFRLSATKAVRPIAFGLPDPVVAALKAPAPERTDEQRAALGAYFRENDNAWRGLQQRLEEARQPRPEDPKLVELRTHLETVSRPLPEDPKLVRLRSDVALSAEQLKNRRLTTAQDLAWALINTPAFLFNR